MTREQSLKELMQIPGVGKSLSQDLLSLGIKKVQDLQKKNPETLYNKLNKLTGTVQDRCMLYVFRCAVYYASTPDEELKPELLKWWNWKDSKTK